MFGLGSLPLSTQGSTGEAVAQRYTGHSRKGMTKVLQASQDQWAKQAQDRRGFKLEPGPSYTRLEPSYTKTQCLSKDSVSPGTQRSLQLRA